MRTLHPARRGALIPLAFCLVIACKDAPASPQSAISTDPAFDRERGGDEGRGQRIEFAKLNLFFEFNSTDNDLGVQLQLDGEPWDLVRGFDPAGRTFVEFFGRGRMEDLGLTELFFESAEPSPDEVLALFPPGRYRFVGRGVEDQRLVGTAMLSHNLPPAPVFSPSGGEEVDKDDVVIKWSPIPGVAAYQVIVADEEQGTQMEITLLPSVTQVTVPPELLEEDTEYKVEVIAVAQNGNKTITESTFVTK
jgi:hypothetical protein